MEMVYLFLTVLIYNEMSTSMIIQRNRAMIEGSINSTSVRVKAIQTKFLDDPLVKNRRPWKTINISFALWNENFRGSWKCVKFAGNFCENDQPSGNRTFVLQNTTTDLLKLDDIIKRIFDVLSDEFADHKDCLDAMKWLACSTTFPSCDEESNSTSLPCKETFYYIISQKCAKEWHRFNVLQFAFSRIIMSNNSYIANETHADCLIVTQAPDVVTSEKPRSKLIVIIGASVGAGLALVLIVTVALLSFIFCCHEDQKKIPKRGLSLKEVREVHVNIDSKRSIEDLLGDSSPEYESLGQLIEALQLPVFNAKNLMFIADLGEGAFGKVVKCEARDVGDGNNEDFVAVKYLKPNPSSEMEKTFEKEVEILSNFHHRNIIAMLGVCLDGPKCIVLEFMKHGDLNQYIRLRSGSYHAVAGSCGNLPDGVEFNTPELSYHNLLLICCQIADGLSYLASKRFVHRDIATRNILVGDNLQIKISDFGLAHDIYGSDYYRVDSQKMLPLRWLSPEALTLGRFTIYSDIWALGVTMWEIFTYGMQPFYGCNNEEVCDRVRCHKYLERPYCCPQKIYDLMKSCWKFEPTQRKSSLYIRQTISMWLQNEEKFIKESWERLLLPPLPDRQPTIKKAKLRYLNARSEITL